MITVNGYEPTFSVFPNGELNVALSKSLLEYSKRTLEANIEWHFNSNEEVVKLALLISALEPSVDTINVHGGYLPYSRMDRREEDKHNPFSLEAFINLLPATTLGTDITYSYEDVHNLDVANQLFDRRRGDNIRFHYQLTGVGSVFHAKVLLGKFDKVLIVLPDKGSKKRYNSLISDGKMPMLSNSDADIAVGYKNRDFDTHKITNFGITNLVDDKPLTKEYVTSFDKIAIIDDVVSYGNTFINLLDYLGNLGAKDVDLIVGNVEDALWRGDLLSNKYLGHVYTSGNLTNHTSDSNVIIY